MPKKRRFDSESKQKSAGGGCLQPNVLNDCENI